MSLIQYVDLIVGIVIIAISILVGAGLVFTTKKYVAKLFKQRKEVQRYIVATVRGPVFLLIIAAGVIMAVSYWNMKIPGFLPYWIEPDYLIIIVQILAVAFVVRLLTVIVNNFLAIRSERILRQRPEVEQSLKLLQRAIVYCMYVAGIVVIVYLFVVSPITPLIGVELVSAILLYVIGLTLIFLMVYILNTFMTRYIHGVLAREPKLITTLTFLRRLILGVAIFIGVVALTFSIFPAASGVVASIFVAAGFASIVVGLAAQSSLSNIISGLVVAISQPFRVGDSVMFRNDFCFVEDIKLMHTVLRTWDNRRLIVPNSILQSEVIVNYSIGDPTMLVPVTVQVSYESDLEKAMKIMVDVAKKHPDYLPTDGLPNVVVMEFADSGINLRLLSRAKDQPAAWKMARDLLFQIKKEFDSNGIEIPYPRRFIVLDKKLEEQIVKIADALHILANNVKKHNDTTLNSSTN